VNMVIDGYVLDTIKGGKPVVGLDFENGVTATTLLDTGCNLGLVIDDPASVSDMGLIVLDSGMVEEVETANGKAKYKIGIVNLLLGGHAREVSIHIRQPDRIGSTGSQPISTSRDRRKVSDEMSGHLPLLFGTQLLEGCHLTVIFARIQSERRVTIRPI
jgi:predicted aspartyl protease